MKKNRFGRMSLNDLQRIVVRKTLANIDINTTESFSMSLPYSWNYGFREEEVGTMFWDFYEEGELENKTGYAWFIEKIEKGRKDGDWVYNVDVKRVIREGYLPTKRTFIDETSLADMIPLLSNKGIIFGDLYITKNAEYLIYKNISVEETYDRELSGGKLNPFGFEVKKDSFVLEYSIRHTGIKKRRGEDGYDEGYIVSEWEDKRAFFDEESEVERLFKELDPIRLEENQDGFEKMIDGVMEHGVDIISEQLMLGQSEEESKNELVGFASKEYLTMIANKMEKSRQTAIKVCRGVELKNRIKKMEIDITVKNSVTDVSNITAILNRQVLLLKSKIEKMNRLIAVLEIYAGINEELYQIQSGETAKDEKLYLRQKVVFLDEEMAEFMDQGLEWNTIEDFDKWFLEGEKYKELLPEEKCVVLCRVRRKDKKRSWIENPFFAYMMKENENRTLVLMRNGDNVYRVCTEHISTISNTMFPKTQELNATMSKINELKDELDSQEHSPYHTEQYVKNIDEQELSLFHYKKTFMLIHGIISRTDVLQPFPENINILNPSTYGDFIQYVYDAEMVIASSEETFSNWLKRMNSKTTYGSLIYLSNEILSDYKNNTSEDWDDRYKIYWGETNSRPPLPSSGVYSVKKETIERSIYNTIWLSEQELVEGDYNLDDVDYNVTRDEKFKMNIPWEDGSKSKKVKETIMRITYPRREGSDEKFKIDRFKDKKDFVSFIIKDHDNFYINLDEVTSDDLRKHIENKAQRESYLKYMPILVGLKGYFEDQQNIEDQFADSMAKQLSLKTNVEEEKVLSIIKDNINWYKNKLPIKIKRPLPSEGLELKKSWDAIELQTLRTLKKTHKIKSLDVSGINKSGVFSFVMEDVHVFVVAKNGLDRHKRANIFSTVKANSKSEAVDVIYNLLDKKNIEQNHTDKIRYFGYEDKRTVKVTKYADKRIPKSLIGKSLFEPTEGVLGTFLKIEVGDGDEMIINMS